MIAFVVENISTIIISCLLILVMVIIIKKQFFENKGCGNNCSGCAMSKHCHSKK